MHKVTQVYDKLGESRLSHMTASQGVKKVNCMRMTP